MNKNIFLLFLILLLLVRPISASGSSSSYSVGSTSDALASAEAESDSYTLTFEMPYGQNTQTGASSNSYYFGQYSGDVEIGGDDTPYQGSSGGGGGISQTEEKPDFNVSPTELKYFLKVGQEKSKDITIENKGNEEITINIVESSGFIGVEQKSLTLLPGKSKKLYILVSAMGQKEGIYTNKITLTSGDVEKEVILLIEIEKAQPEIDLLVDVLEEDKIIFNQNNISSTLTLYDLGGEDKLNVTLEYFIQDLNGNVLIEESENKIIDSGVSFTKSVNLLEKLGAGDYVFSVKATSGDKTVFSGSLFKVLSSEEEQTELANALNDYDLIIKFGIFIFLFVFVIILFESEKLNLMISLCEFNIKHKDFYHAKLNYNKLVKMFKNHAFKKDEKEKMKRRIHDLHKHIIREENS